MASAARVVARVIRPIRARWLKYWNVDHRAVNFYNEDEFEEARERYKERYDQAMKGMAVSHMKNQFIPRVSIDMSQGINAVKVAPRAEPLQGDLYGKCVVLHTNNRALFSTSGAE